MAFVLLFSHPTHAVAAGCAVERERAGAGVRFVKNQNVDDTSWIYEGQRRLRCVLRPDRCGC